MTTAFFSRISLYFIAWLVTIKGFKKIKELGNDQKSFFILRQFPWPVQHRLTSSDLRKIDNESQYILDHVLKGGDLWSKNYRK